MSVESLLEAHDIKPQRIEHIRAGRNSEVLRIHATERDWIIKRYLQQATDPRDRLGTEFRFLQFCNRHGLQHVPTAIAMDRESGCVLYDCLPGTRPASITQKTIDLASGFLLALNQLRDATDARLLPPAADACFSTANHLELVSRRVERLRENDSPAAHFINDTLIPAWERLLTSLETISDFEPAHILSPSDFGFHNTLEHQTELFFVDFEYAGWDSPVKLLCDFICQPEIPVTVEQARSFMSSMLSGLQDDDRIAAEVSALLPAHRLKWCCIMLNEFSAEGYQRRRHAGINDNHLLDTQLKKVEHYFNSHIRE